MMASAVSSKGSPGESGEVPSPSQASGGSHTSKSAMRSPTLPSPRSAALATGAAPGDTIGKSQAASGGGPYECEICGAQFRKPQALGGHKSAHRSDATVAAIALSRARKLKTLAESESGDRNMAAAGSFPHKGNGEAGTQELASRPLTPPGSGSATPTDGLNFKAGWGHSHRPLTGRNTNAQPQLRMPASIPYLTFPASTVAQSTGATGIGNRTNLLVAPSLRPQAAPGVQAGAADASGSLGRPASHSNLNAVLTASSSGRLVTHTLGSTFTAVPANLTQAGSRTTHAAVPAASAASGAQAGAPAASLPASAAAVTATQAGAVPPSPAMATSSGAADASAAGPGTVSYPGNVLLQHALFRQAAHQSQQPSQPQQQQVAMLFPLQLLQQHYAGMNVQGQQAEQQQQQQQQPQQHYLQQQQHVGANISVFAPVSNSTATNPATSLLGKRAFADVDGATAPATLTSAIIPSPPERPGADDISQTAIPPPSSTADEPRKRPATVAPRDWMTSSPVGGEWRVSERSPSQAVPELVPVVGVSRGGSAAGVVTLSGCDKGDDVATRNFLTLSHPIEQSLAKQPSLDLTLRLGC